MSGLEEDILTLLVSSELCGLAIIDAINEATEGKRQLGFGSLYPTMHKLEKKGFVSSWWGEDRPEERGHARRRYYTATGLGERVLREAQQLRMNLAQWRPAWERG